MKKTITLLLCFLSICLFKSCDELPELPENLPLWYAIEKGVIEYGDLGTLYFDDFGRMERHEWQNGKVMLYLPDKTVELDPEAKTYKILIEMEKLNSYHYFGDEVSWYLSSKFNAKRTNEEIIGKPCIVWVGTYEEKEIKYGGWKRIIFVAELDADSYRATSFTEELPEGNLFEIPEDYTQIVIEE